MNNDLIDLHILSLLRIPAEQRTQARVALALADIAQAARLETAMLANPVTEQNRLQQEHLKLAAIAEFLRQELGFEHCSVPLDLRESYNQWDRPLSVILSNYKGETFMHGRGRTAEECLQDLCTLVKSRKAA